MAKFNCILSVSPQGNGLIKELSLGNGLTLSPISSIQADGEFHDNKIVSITNLFGTSENLGKKCAILGSATIGGDYTLTSVNEYKGFILNTISNSLSLSVVGEDVYTLTFYFDEYAGQYPRTITSSVQISVERPTNYCAIISSETHISNIEFSSWNASNYPPCITHIDVTPKTISFPKSNIESFESTLESSSNGENIFNGVLSSTGSMTIKDIVSKNSLNEYVYTLQSYAENGWLQKGKNNIEFNLNNNLVRVHTSDSTPYLNDENLLEITLADNFSIFDKQVSFTKTQPFTLYDVLTDVLSYVGIDVNTSVEFDYYIVSLLKPSPVYVATKTVEDVFKAYYFTQDLVVEEKSVTEILNQMCELVQSSFIPTQQGKYKFVCNRPIFKATSRSDAKVRAIDIPTNILNSTLKYNLITSNNIRIIEYNEKKYEFSNNVFTLVREVSQNLEADYVVNKNMFLDITSTFKASELYSFNPSSVIARNYVLFCILQDYNGGIHSGEVEILLGTNLYEYVNGEKTSNVLVDFKNGGLIQVGNVINLNKTPEGYAYLVDSNKKRVYFKVISQTIRWDSQFYQKLKLLQCKNL